MLGVVNDVPVPNDVPPDEAAYQFYSAGRSYGA